MRSVCRLSDHAVDDATAPHDAIALDLEDVGEIGADRDLQVEAHWVLAVIGDVDIVVQSALDMAADHQAQRARCDRTVLAHEGAIGLEDARRMRGDGAAIQQVPRLAIGIDRPGADHPGVTKIQPAVAGPVHLPVGLGQQHRLPLMDGDLRRADLNLERHPHTPLYSHLSAASREPWIKRHSTIDEECRANVIGVVRCKPDGRTGDISSPVRP